ncbi:MAG TPA: hypothetical protein VNM14_17965 [Planctomycetota bacterium]|nr:hypothetical protein [Planctomycetota bacterium]
MAILRRLLNASLLSLLLASCATSDREILEPFSWRVPWKVGDRIEIVRVEETQLTRAALDLKTDGVIPSEFGWKSRLVFHATVTGTNQDSLQLDLWVASARIEAKGGNETTTNVYERGKGQRDVETGEVVETAKAFERPYRCTVNQSGIMTDWEHRLDATACLHGLGGEYYNVFTSVLLKLPLTSVSWGHSWQTKTAVTIAHCDQVPFVLACVLERGASASQQDGYSIGAKAFLDESAAEHLGSIGAQIGSGRWWISPDRRRVEGRFVLDLAKDGKRMLLWRDEVLVAPLRN